MCFAHRFSQGMSGVLCIIVYCWHDVTLLLNWKDRYRRTDAAPKLLRQERHTPSAIVIFFLRICFWDCNVLIFRTPRKRKQPKETNWKQKIQKLQNENICLTCLNVENNGNFPILSFSWVLYGAKNVRWNLIFCSTIRFIYCISWKRICEKWTFHVALYSIFEENTHVFITFFE